MDCSPKHTEAENVKKVDIREQLNTSLRIVTLTQNRETFPFGTLENSTVITIMVPSVTDAMLVLL